MLVMLEQPSGGTAGESTFAWGKQQLGQYRTKKPQGRPPQKQANVKVWKYSFQRANTVNRARVNVVWCGIVAQ
jgi:hypothetical protein